MKSRRRSRELALQFLYQLDLKSGADPTPHEREFWDQQGETDGPTRDYTATLVQGAQAARAKIDELITRSTEHWDLERMSMVDRNILRVAVFELAFQHEVPAKVAINEAIEIAKKFGTRESSRFINGVLDRVHRELQPAS